MSDRKVLWYDQPLEVLETELANAVYAASVGIFEHAETRGLIRGNGHHMAQELAQKAAEILMERRK